MPARTGSEYLKGLQAQEREVWLRGERVKDVTTHPGLRNGALAIASLYDMQHDPQRRDEMTYVSPTSGDRVGLSFINPHTREDVERRGQMMLNWARTTCGMMGRSPDFMNVTFAAWGAAADYFARGRPQFGQNIKRYYEYIRENDLTLTHSLINLQRSRDVSGMFNLKEGTALRIVRETDAGVVVRGARVLATLGPLSDEIGVALLITETLGNAHLPHAEERIGELIMYTELMKACMRASEADAKLNQWGVMCPAAMPAEVTRNLFMTAYPRMVEILQLLGSSSFMIVPSEADFAGPLQPEIEQYLATDSTSARDRVKLFRLAWDIAGSSFGSRQVLYERFFASDPLTRARVLKTIFPTKEVTDRVRQFLARSDDTA